MDTKVAKIKQMLIETGNFLALKSIKTNIKNKLAHFSGILSLYIYINCAALNKLGTVPL